MLCALLFFTAGCTPRVEDLSTKDSLEAKMQTDETTAGNQPEMQELSGETPTENQPTAKTPPLEELLKKTIQATITMEDGGTIVLELYPDLAPQSVQNFIYLARQGFYDGLKFHRIIKGFMIQGGDPDGTGGGGPGYTIKGEFKRNGFTNDLKHTRGVLSMARGNELDSAGSQFFIMHTDITSLDGEYAAFGRVISGMDVVDIIAATPNSGPNGAVAEENKPIMKTITIDDNSELPEPEMIR
jgi:peptidyl-prolyl cis-trans isomerase B (cyclophilin B)